MKTRRRQRTRKSQTGGITNLADRKIGGITNKYIALDCEMVEGLRRKPMVAEVALVDWNGDVIYHTYVQPTGPVKNYREEITGLTHDILDGARPFEEVQAEVLSHLQGKIVVGHALENDLRALQIRLNPADIRNTAHHPFFQTLGSKTLQPQKLAKLYETYVGNAEIQKGHHGAIEDARASMQLYKTYHTAWDIPVVHSGPIRE